MAFVVAPSRNPTLQLAWKMHKAAQKAEGRAPKTEEPPAPVKKAAAKKGGKRAK